MKYFYLLVLLFAFNFTFSQTLSDSITVCEGNSVDYKAFNPSAVSWEWGFEGGVPDTSTQQNPQNINYPTVGEFITFCISTFNNGDKDTNYLKVKVRTDLLDSIDLSDTIMCEGGGLTLDAGFDDSNPRINYLWTSPTLSIDDIFVETKTLQVDKPGLYNIRVFTACNFVEKTIEVKGTQCSSIIHIPNAFTPEGNGLNETYSVYVGEHKTFNLRIFNRWGEKIYETNNPNFRWNGNYKNVPVQPGAYVVVVEVSTESFVTQRYMSTVNVIR
jgi:gliding motility-associated-like protein